MPVVHALRRFGVLWAALAACGAHARSAAAHGNTPALTSMAFGGGSGTDLLLGTTFGALHSRDGHRFELICEESIGDTQPAQVAWLDGDGIIASTTKMVSLSRDGGCSFTPVESLRDLGVSDLAVKPSDRRVIYATTAKNTVANTLYRSLDAGVSFQPTTLVKPHYLSGVVLPAAAPRRVYVSAWQPSADPLLMVSDDDGAHFEERPHPSDTATPLYLLGASPSDGNVLFTRTFTSTGHAIWRTSDAGKHFDKVLDVGTDLPGTLTVSTDGQTVLLGTSGGLYRSGDGGKTFARPTQNVARPCAALRDGQVYACGDLFSATDWAVAVQRTSAGPWDVLMPGLDALSGIRTCPANSPTTTICTAAWQSLSAWLGIDVPVPPLAKPDAATGDSGAADTTKATGCACSNGPKRSGSFAWFSCAAAAVLISRRRSAWTTRR